MAVVEEYDQYLPWCTKSKILHRFSPNKFDAELSVGFKNVYQERYISRVTLVPESEIRVIMHSSPVLKSLSNSWTLTDHEEGCEVSFDVQFEFRNIYHSTAAQMFFKEVHSRMLRAFLERAQEKHEKS